MKKKKPAKNIAVNHQPIEKEVAVQPEAVPAAVPVLEEQLTSRDKAELIVFAVLLLAGMTVMTVPVSLLLMAVAVLACIGKQPWARVRARLSIPVLGLLVLAVAQGAAAIYTPMDNLAVGEYAKFLAAFALTVIALARFDKKHVNGLLWGVAAVCAFIGLICVDIGGTQLLFTPFNAMTSALGMDYSSVLEGSAGLRNNGLYNDANVTGVLVSVTAFVGLYLAAASKAVWQRMVACILTGISVVALLLSVSRGAWLCFAISLVVYLVAEREQRVRRFFLLCAVGIGALCAGVPALLAMGTALPLLLALVCGVVIFLLDYLVAERATALVLAHKKGMRIGVGALAAACVLVVVLALTLHKPYTFDEGQILLRAVELPAGTYTVSGDWDDADVTNVYLYTQSKEQLMTGEQPIIYAGLLKDCTFTLEKESTVFFRFGGVPGCQLRQVVLSNGKEIPLAYTLLPEMIASRLQGNFLESTSFVLRLQYDIDALKLFAQSPLLGHGLASTEGFFTAVQPVYYESKYVHNHILQVMADMGLVGLVGFLGVLLGSAWLLLRRLRRQADPLAAALLAAWVMLNTHSLIEINFSTRPVQCLGYLLLLLPVILYHEPIAQRAKGRNERKNLEFCGTLLAGALCLYMVIFGVLLQSHRMVQDKALNFTTGDVAEYLDTVNGYIKKDVFDREELMLSYVSQALRQSDSRYYPDMMKYVQKLRGYQTFTAATGLATYYYLPIGDFEQGFACSREGISQKMSDDRAWNHQFDFYQRQTLNVVNAENVEQYIKGVLDTAAYMEAYNQKRLDPVVLEEKNQAFLKQVIELQDVEPVVAAAVLADLYESLE